MRFFLVRSVLFFRLGFLNIIRNVWYKKKLRSGHFITASPVIVSDNNTLPLFVISDSSIYGTSSSDKNWISPEFNYDIENLLQGRFKLFFREVVNVGNPSNSFFHSYKSSTVHWSQSEINTVAGEDIKVTWDISRFHWMQQLACAYSVNRDPTLIHLLNNWFFGWSEKNAINAGVNWSCAQECSIRIIHILNACKVLPEESYDKQILSDLVKKHAERIYHTIDYAISQDNNHGVTEAAALFICGAWLLNNLDTSGKFATRMALKGRSVLENRVSRLIMGDGGFSMYSTNYHRIVLNTLSIVEVWRQELNEPTFSTSYIKNCQSAINWLYILADESHGDTINLGTNDGSNPFIVQSTDYRDYRPAIQFASVMFNGGKIYESSPIIDEPLLWLNLDDNLPVIEQPKVKSQVLMYTGLSALFGRDIGLNDTNVFIKYPNYAFRPGQSDALHVDLWHKGINVLRDAGSYSYNGTLDEDKYFSSIRAHNTVQVDNIEPMPKLGQFLRHSWSKMDDVSDIINDDLMLSWSGRYTIKKGISHEREVSLSSGKCSVIDTVAGAKQFFTIRWRLDPVSWQLDEVHSCLSSSNMVINVLCDNAIDIRLTQGFESRYYNQYDDVPILEIVVKAQYAQVTTEIYMEK